MVKIPLPIGELFLDFKQNIQIKTRHTTMMIEEIPPAAPPTAAPITEWIREYTQYYREFDACNVKSFDATNYTNAN